MSDGRLLLIEILEKNGGERAFPKYGNTRLLQILEDLTREGKIERIAETEREIVYRLRKQG